MADYIPSDASSQAADAQNYVENVASGVRNERTVVTSTGKAIPPPRRGVFGHCDTILAVVTFAMWVSLLGVSAAALKNIKDARDQGRTDVCFVQSQVIWREMIGLVAISAAAVAHSIIQTVLGGAKKGGPIRYAVNLCILPHAIVSLVLGCIVVAWMAPEGYYGNGSTRTAILDLCQTVDPFNLAFAAGAMAIAFGGFVLLTIPLCQVIACVGDAVTNPKVQQARQVVTEEGGAFFNRQGFNNGQPAAVTAVRKARDAAAYNDYSESESYGDEESGAY